MKLIFSDTFNINKQKDIQKLKKQERSTRSNSFIGYVYILEYGDAIKIGCTRNPYQRLHELSVMAQGYADKTAKTATLSQPHTNYREIEKFLHEYFSDKRRKGTELFDLSFDSCLDTINSLDIAIRDDTVELRQRDEKAMHNIKQIFFAEPEKRASVGEIVELLEVLVENMKDQGHSPETVSAMIEKVCGQFGIGLPNNYVKPNPYQQITFIVQQGPLLGEQKGHVTHGKSTKPRY